MTEIQIQCFLSAARSGSITAASRELFLSGQVVSRHILNLEKELSARLFLRLHDGVELTERGREFLDYATRMVGLYNGTMRSVREQYENLTRRFRIGITEYIDPVGRISGSIADFAQAHPTTDISGVQYGSQVIMDAISDGEIDVALVCDTQITVGGDFDIVPFAREDLRLYVSHGPELSGCSVGDERVRAVCGELPHLDSSYGPWSGDEWREISRRMSAYLGMTFGKSYNMPNFRAIVASANTVACVVVCDARFGYLRDNEYLQSLPLHIESNICCISDRKNENPLVREFGEHMKRYYREE